MTEIYRKFGRVIRRENDFLVSVGEAGEAVEDGGTFTCYPIDEQRRDLSLDAAEVNAAADAIARLVAKPLILERAIVSEGVAVHQYGEIEWSERTRRIHLSIAHPPYRALIDLAAFSIEGVQRVCEALARVEGERPSHGVRLAESVGAALLPSLIGVLPMQQWAAPHDGKGAWIANLDVDEDAPPNWFRPSYRARPIRAWFHLRAEPKGAIDPGVPEAIALVAPIHDRTLQLLCVEGGRAFVTTAVAANVRAVAPAATWYPYAAGCFGAEIML